QVSYSGSWLNRLCMKRSLKLRGHRLKVRHAPEPSTILWENFGYTRCELFQRRSVTVILAGCFLCVSVAVAFLSLYQSQQAAAEGGGGECPADWDALSDSEQRSLIEEDSKILHCYCSDISLSTIDPGDVCFNYLTATVTALWLSLATGCVVAFTNAFSNKLMRFMGPYERFLTVDRQEVSIFRRLLLLKFINVAVSVLITNSKFLIDLFAIDITYKDDFNKDWYRSLGSTLILITLTNAVTPHLYWLYLWFRQRRQWVMRREFAVSQDDLNALTRGAQWEVSVRYAEISVIFAVCLMYSAGIPVLLPIGAVSFFLFYWVEKVLFINFYRTPPQYSQELANEVLSFIPYCLWLHVVFSIYMFGNGSVFPVTKDEEFAQELTEEASLTFDFGSKLNATASKPLIVPLLVLTGYILKLWLGSTVFSVAGKFLSFLTCRGKIKSTK
ncbi:unnamed protein product, partial [Discosporangium mesarthrocarpum]